MNKLTRRTLLCGLGAGPLAMEARAQSGLRDLAIPIPSVSFVSAAVRAANVLGLFAQHGINVRPVTMDSGNAVTSALISRSVEVGLGGPGELVAADARGQQVVIITDAYRGFGASLVLTKAAVQKTGIDPSAPASARIKALDGLLIASPSATSSYTAGYRGAAEAAGAKIRFTYLSQPAMVAAMEAGAIEGMIAGAPFWGFPIVRGTGVLWLSGPKGDLPFSNVPASSASLQAMRPFAEANPALMQQLRETMRDFATVVQTHPDQVKGALLKLYPDVDPATMDVLFSSESRAWDFRPLTPADMQHEIDFVRSGSALVPGLDHLNPERMLYMPAG